jgi:mono/diheme cytochrome c family protein
MKPITIIVCTILATLALVWLGVVGVAYAGTINVASTADYVFGAEWFFSTLSDRSIRRHAEKAVRAGEIVPPAEVSEAMLETGASHYDAMCVVCHGGPGRERGEFGQGLKPQPPDLSHSAREMSEAEILWVLEHGIQHTGMPAFGETHSLEELQALTALVARFDGMSPEEFERLAGSAATGGAGHHHGEGEAGRDHGDAGGEHEHDPGGSGHEHDDASGEHDGAEGGAEHSTATVRPSDHARG